MDDEQYVWWGLSAAGWPTTGASFFLLLPGLDTASFPVFLEAFGAYVNGNRVGLVLDGSGVHRAEELRWPNGVVPGLPSEPVATRSDTPARLSEPSKVCILDVQELWGHKNLSTTQRYLHVRGQNRYQVMEVTSL